MQAKIIAVLRAKEAESSAMTKPPDDKVVSIVGSAYFQPIADLLDDLLSRPKPMANDVKTSQREYGLACAISLLAVVCFESCAMRVRYLNRALPAAQKRSALEFLRALYPKFPNIDDEDEHEFAVRMKSHELCRQHCVDELSEVFVLRDIIAHNHLWEIGFSWDDQPDMVLLSASKDPISGDAKYLRHVDPSTRKTKLLQLNAVPIKVDRSDASKLLKVVWNALLFLEQQDRNQCYVSHLTVLFKGKFPRFGDVVNSLP